MDDNTPLAEPPAIIKDQDLEKELKEKKENEEKLIKGRVAIKIVHVKDYPKEEDLYCYVVFPDGKGNKKEFKTNVGKN